MSWCRISSTFRGRWGSERLPRTWEVPPPDKFTAISKMGVWPFNPAGGQVEFNTMRHSPVLSAVQLHTVSF